MWKDRIHGSAKRESNLMLSECSIGIMHLRSWWLSTPHGKIHGTWQAGLWVVQRGSNPQGC